MDRKERILKLLEEGYTNAKQLASYFNVSLMTIYRDLRELEEEGKIVRKHGSIELKKEDETKGKNCVVCGKESDLRLAVVYILKGGKKIHTCCAHCGLIAYKSMKREDIEMVFTRDFITCNPISAFSAYYVVGSVVSPCCFPPAVPFADRTNAERFAKGFEGEVLEFQEAVERMDQLMKMGQRVDIL